MVSPGLAMVLSAVFVSIVPTVPTKQEAVSVSLTAPNWCCPTAVTVLV